MAQIAAALETASVPPPVAPAEKMASEIIQRATSRETGFLRMKEIGNNPSPKEHDVSLLTLGIVAQKGNELLEGKEANPDSLKAIANKDQAAGEVAFFSYLFRSDFKATRLAGQPLVVEIGGQNVDISQINTREGNVFKCLSQDGKSLDVGVDALLTAQLKSAFGSSEVKKLFNEKQIKVIDAYLKGVSGEKNAADAIEDPLLKELALDAGFITAESAKQFAEKNKPTLSDEKKPQLDEALKSLEGRTIASPEVLSSICEIIVPDNIASSLEKTKQSIAEIEKKVEGLGGKNPGEQKKLEKELIQLNESQALITETQEFFKNSQVIENFFGQVQRGEIEVETVKKLNTAMENNNNEKMIEALMTSKKVKDEDKEKAKKIPGFLKIGGGLSLGLFFMLLWKGIKGEGGIMGGMMAGGR